MNLTVLKYTIAIILISLILAETSLVMFFNISASLIIGIVYHIIDRNIVPIPPAGASFAWVFFVISLAALLFVIYRIYSKLKKSA